MYGSHRPPQSSAQIFQHQNLTVSKLLCGHQSMDTSRATVHYLVEDEEVKHFNCLFMAMQMPDRLTGHTSQKGL